jgi:protein-S-isoprenylcysteine O-methyltransferase Ste14
MFRPSREPGTSRYFEIKALLLVLGASVGVVGMAQERSWLVWIGIAILLVAMILRLWASRKKEPD